MGPAIRFVCGDIDDTLLDHRGAERRALRDLCWAYPELTRARGARSLYRRLNVPLGAAYGRGELEAQALRRLRFRLWLALLGADSERWVEPEAYYLKPMRRVLALAAGRSQGVAICVQPLASRFALLWVPGDSAGKAVSSSETTGRLPGDLRPGAWAAQVRAGSFRARLDPYGLSATGGAFYWR